MDDEFNKLLETARKNLGTSALNQILGNKDLTSKYLDHIQKMLSSDGIKEKNHALLYLYPLAGCSQIDISPLLPQIANLTKSDSPQIVEGAADVLCATLYNEATPINKKVETVGILLDVLASPPSPNIITVIKNSLQKNELYNKILDLHELVQKLYGCDAIEQLPLEKIAAVRQTVRMLTTDQLMEPTQSLKRGPQQIVDTRRPATTK